MSPSSRKGGAGGTSAGPLREVVEGSSHCSPEGCFTRREDSDGHAVNRANIVWYATAPQHGGSGWSRLGRPALNAVGCRRHAIVEELAPRDSEDARTHPLRWDGTPRRHPPHSRA